MKKINAFLLILLSIVMIVSCPDNGADKPKTFSITYKSNIDGIEDITETYTIGDENMFPPLSFNGVEGKYVVGYSATKVHSDAGTVDYIIGGAIDFTSDKTVYTVWKEGTVYTLSLDGRGATLKPFDNFYYTVSKDGQGEWYRDISLDSSKKITVGETIERPEYNKTLKFNSNMDEVANPSDMQRNWNVYYSQSPDVSDYSYYFSKSTDPNKKEDMFDITKSIDKNTVISISWVEQQQMPGQDDHTYDLPFVSKKDKWFKGWRKPNKALFEKFDSNGDETLTLTGSWMDTVSKENGSEEVPEALTVTIAKIEYILDTLRQTKEHFQETFKETATDDPDVKIQALQNIAELNSMESSYKTFTVSKDSKLFAIYIEEDAKAGTADQAITYLTFDGKIDDQRYNIEFKISYDTEKQSDRYSFLIVNGVSYNCNDAFHNDLDAALGVLVGREEGSNL